MKKYLFLILLFPGLVLAESAIISDPFPVDPNKWIPPTFCAMQDASSLTAPVKQFPVEALAGGTTRCNLDITTLPVGQYTMNISSGDANGKSTPVPFTFAITKQGPLPVYPIPTGWKIVK